MAMTRVSAAGLGWGLCGMLSAQQPVQPGSAKVAYGDAHGDVYNDLKHVVSPWLLCVYIIYGGAGSGPG